MLILIGANSKATSRQCEIATQLGRLCSKNKILCIHGGGEGTMKAVTEGILENNHKDLILFLSRFYRYGFR